MSGPLFAVGRALLGNQLTQPLMNEMAVRGLDSGILSPEVARMLYSNQTFGEQLSNSVEPLGRLLGLLPEERPNYNLPEDYSVGPQGGIYNLAGDRMVTGEGVTGFQPEAQYGEYAFQEPAYEPPIPNNYSLYNAGEIPSQIALGQPIDEFPTSTSRNFDLWEPSLSTSPPGLQQPEQVGTGFFMPAGGGQPDLQQSQADEEEQRRRYWQDATGGAHGGVVANGVIAQRKRQQEEAAKMKAQALLRTGVPMPDEYRQGGRVRMI